MLGEITPMSATPNEISDVLDDTQMQATQQIQHNSSQTKRQEENIEMLKKVKRKALESKIKRGKSQDLEPLEEEPDSQPPTSQEKLLFGPTLAVTRETG